MPKESFVKGPGRGRGMLGTGLNPVTCYAGGRSRHGRSVIGPVGHGLLDRMVGTSRNDPRQSPSPLSVAWSRSRFRKRWVPGGCPRKVRCRGRAHAARRRTWLGRRQSTRHFASVCEPSRRRIRSGLQLLRRPHKPKEAQHGGRWPGGDATMGDRWVRSVNQSRYEQFFQGEPADPEPMIFVGRGPIRPASMRPRSSGGRPIFRVLAERFCGTAQHLREAPHPVRSKPSRSQRRPSHRTRPAARRTAFAASSAPDLTPRPCTPLDISTAERP